MTTQQAVCERIRELMCEKKMSANKLAERSGVHHSTLDGMLADQPNINNTGIVTIKKLCQGFGISFKHFFDSPLFRERNLEYEE